MSHPDASSPQQVSAPNLYHAGRPTSLVNDHMWCPDGLTLYYYGGRSPVFAPPSFNTAMCPDWSPLVRPWYYPHDKVAKLSVGNGHVLYVCESGKVYAAGSNQFGQLGQRDTRAVVMVPYLGDQPAMEVPFPATRDASDPFVQIEAGIGAGVSFALTAKGLVYGCGELCGRVPSAVTDPQSGASFQANAEMGFINPSLFNNSPVRQVSAGGCVVGFITEEGAVYICGVASNSEGAGITAGLAEATGQHMLYEPTRVQALWDADFRATAISCGRMHTIVAGRNLKSGAEEVYGWGSNRRGQLGFDPARQPDAAVPTLLSHVMDKLSSSSSLPLISDGKGGEEAVAYLCCGWYSSFITLRSGAVLSLGVDHLGTSGVAKREGEGSDSCCEFVELDRPVRVAFPGANFSLFVPPDSTLLLSPISKVTDLSSALMGTCGQANNGQLALYAADDIVEDIASRYRCQQRLKPRFFTMREAMDSAPLAPKVPENPPPAAEPNAGVAGFYSNDDAARKRGRALGRGVDESDPKSRSDDENEASEIAVDDDIDDEGRVYIRIDFSVDNPADNYTALLTKLLPALQVGWSEELGRAGGGGGGGSDFSSPLSPTDLLKRIEEAIQASKPAEARWRNRQAAIDVTKTRAQRIASKPYRRYVLVLSNQFNPASVNDLIAILLNREEDGNEKKNNIVDKDTRAVLSHVLSLLEGVTFVSSSLLADSAESVRALAAALLHQPFFSWLTLDMASLYDTAAIEASKAMSNEVPYLEDPLWAVFMETLLSSTAALTPLDSSSSSSVMPSSRTRPKSEASAASESVSGGVSRIESIAFSSMNGVGSLTLKAIYRALAAVPPTLVALRELLCSGIGYKVANGPNTDDDDGDDGDGGENDDGCCDEECGEGKVTANLGKFDLGVSLVADASKGEEGCERGGGGYEAVGALIGLNLPTLIRVHLSEQDDTMGPLAVKALSKGLATNTHLMQLSLSVMEMMVPGVGWGGIAHIVEALEKNPNSVLFDVDVSGDDGQPDVNDGLDGDYDDDEDDNDNADKATAKAKAAARKATIAGRKKLLKQWTALLKRDGQTYLKRLTEVSGGGGAAKQAKKGGKGGADPEAAFISQVLAIEKKRVQYVSKRPIDLSADRWMDDYAYETH